MHPMLLNLITENYLSSQYASAIFNAILRFCTQIARRNMLPFVIQIASISQSWCEKESCFLEERRKTFLWVSFANDGAIRSATNGDAKSSFSFINCFLSWMLYCQHKLTAPSSCFFFNILGVWLGNLWVIFSKEVQRFRESFCQATRNASQSE